MNHQRNRSSAFYSGPTRYGGSSAVAKRREAARKAFFAVKEATGPTISNPNASVSTSKSALFNKDKLIQAYTINNEDIVRREPVEPQLTSHAKRILNWIEKNDCVQQDSLKVSSKMMNRAKIRFNPMAYRAPTTSKPLPEIPVPQLLPPPPPPPVQAPVLKLPTDSSGNSKPFVMKPITSIEAPKSSRFASGQFKGPTENIVTAQCQKRVFSPPKELVTESKSPKQMKQESSPPKQQLQLRPKMQPQVTTQLQPPLQPRPQVQIELQPKPQSQPQPQQPVRIEKNDPIQQDSLKMNSKKTKIRFDSKEDREPAPTPKRAPEIPTIFMPPPPPPVQAPVLKLPTNSSGNSKPFVMKPITSIEAPKSSRFASGQFKGPTENIITVQCQKRVFCPPRELVTESKSPKQMKQESSPPKQQLQLQPKMQPQVTTQPQPPLQPLPQVQDGLEMNLKRMNNSNAKEDKAPTISEPASEKPILQLLPQLPVPTPNTTAPTTASTTFTLPTISNNQFVDMDMEVDADCQSTAVRPVVLPTTQPTSAVTIQPLAPSVNSLFMPTPAPNFPAGFIPAMPQTQLTPVTTSNGTSVNPFHYTPGSTGGRKILRPKRNLPRRN